MKGWIRTLWDRSFDHPGRVLLAGFVLAAVIALLAASFALALYLVDWAAKLA